MAAVTNIDIQEYLLELVTFVKKIPKIDFQVDYDSEADVMYINFGDTTKPAADSEYADNDLIIRYDEQDEIIGFTILHISKR
ncbi:DUF2283 domain-containing protein [Microcoleus sp. FACHB-SPT15]|uniref:DUF2283 domain-containing protein n=1 Tax=Microcoleus sp. FACHB-SPT15 TaxID=2692830 RepID=UPI001783BB26|nr:DUF2283 domain-containing protein [Microcoleus sp. FACHB-SPT15]MBD1806123.1 DUF2283 domain-containing protein [Microcoleus sp. FACHB-SPT15]